MSFSEEISEPCAEGRGVTIDDFRAYMPAHTLHLHALLRVLAGRERQFSPPADAGARRARPAEAQ